MSQRFLKAAAAASVLLSTFGAQCHAQDAFKRPNADVECSSEPANFLAYGESLGLTCGPEECEYKEQAGTLFDIKYRQGYKVIEYNTSPELEGSPMMASTYVLYQCGGQEPDDEWIQERLAANTSTVHFVQIPLTAVANDDSTVGWMLEELDLLDRVRFVGPYATSPCMQKIAAKDGCNRPFVGEYALDADAPKTKLSQYDAEFGFSSDEANKQIYMQASADPGPLARAEHIVYLSAFFNVEQQAMEYYEQVSDSYTGKSIAPADADAPTVAWLTTHQDGGSSYLYNAAGEPLGDGIVAVVSFARYKTLLTSDAGGALPSQAATAKIPGAFASLDDIVFAQSEIGSLADTRKAIKAALKGVDVLIDETYIFGPATVDDLTSFLGLGGAAKSADYPFLTNNNVWRHDKAQTISGGDDWFGQAVARPDILHSDLKEIITPGSVPNHTFRFFRNFSKGDKVDAAGPEQCKELACNAYAKQEPLAIGVPSGAASGAAAGFAAAVAAALAAALM